MDQAQPFQLDLNEPDVSRSPVYRRLGWLNGLLIGLALGLGAWGLEIVRVARLPLPLAVPTALLGIVVLAALGAFVGWLSARLARTWLTALLWLGMGVLTSLLIGYLPFYGRTLMVWLAAPRFFGRDVYPNSLGGSNLGLVLGGLVIIILLGALALFAAGGPGARDEGRPPAQPPRLAVAAVAAADSLPGRADDGQRPV